MCIVSLSNEKLLLHNVLSLLSLYVVSKKHVPVVAMCHLLFCIQLHWIFEITSVILNVSPAHTVVGPSGSQ